MALLITVVLDDVVKVVTANDDGSVKGCMFLRNMLS